MNSHQVHVAMVVLAHCDRVTINACLSACRDVLLSKLCPAVQRLTFYYNCAKLGLAGVLEVGGAM
eukprot:3516323-Amphidinium_carterae.1